MAKKKVEKSAHLVVRSLKTKEEVHRVPVGHLEGSSRNRVLRGMLINMNTDDYYVSEEMLPCATTPKKS